MADEMLNRQVALVSYGNQFLRGELAFDEFFRHSIFFGHRLQFRAPEDNGLLADDFTLWLGVLRESGAHRLSLHRATQFETKAGRARHGGDFVVAVHFGDHCQLWAVGEELAEWWTHPHLPKGSDQHGSACPPAAAYGGDIDSYWCVAAAAGKIAVPATNWTQFATAVSDDLQLTLTAAQSEPFIVYVHDAPGWARFPLFPYSASSLVPHQLMKLLTDAQSAFANDTHCKNEGNIFHLMSAAQAEEKGKWAERLNQWVIDLQLRCANDIQLKGALAEPVHQVQQVQAMAPESTSAEEREPESKWIKAAVFAVLLALISLLLFSASHLVARYPWLSVLLSLPFTTYACWPEKKG